jgi:signal transduction histidine kinase
MTAPVPDCPHCADLRRRLEEAVRERDEFAGFALAGQATAGMAHELNNLLNSVVLQASLLELQLDKAFHGNLDVIRRQALQATGLLRLLGQVSSERSRRFYPVDLNRAMADLLRDDPALAARVHFTPSSSPLPPVRGAVSAVKQLIRLVLSGAAAGSPSPLWVRTEDEGGAAQIRVEGPLSPGGSEAAPTADAVLWLRLGELERLAGQSLLRQLGGELRVTAGPGGEVALRVCWASKS